MLYCYHFVTVVLLSGNSMILHGRSLYWQDMQVRARLDSLDILRISELQTIVFSGSWNGGEWLFLVRSGRR